MRVSIEGALERHGRLAAVGSREIAESFHSRKVAASGPAIDRQLPNRDEDDDIPVVSGSAVVLVRTLPHTPLIKIWAEVAVKVSDLEHAKFEVEVLNRARLWPSSCWSTTGLWHRCTFWQPPWCLSICDRHWP